MFDVFQKPRVSRPVSRFLRREDGALSILTAVLFPAMIMLAGIAIDISDLNAQRKYVQGQADLAALSGVRNLSTSVEARRVAANTLTRDTQFDIDAPGAGDILFGRVDPELGFVANADQTSLDGVTAVKVIGHSPARFPILGLFFTRDEMPRVTRSAVAVAKPRVSFALSNCLLSLHLLNGLLEPLLGADTDLLCSGHGLRINAITLMDQLALRGELLSPSTTYGDILDAEFPVFDVLEAAYGQSGLPGGLTLPSFGDAPVRLGDFLYLAPDLRSAQVTNTLVPPLDVHLADIFFGSLEILGERIVDLQADLTLGEFAGAAINVQISEPRVVVLGAIPGSAEAMAHTSQIRIGVEGLHLSSLLRLSLGLNVANSAAVLSPEGRHCSREDKDVAAVFDPVSAELLNVDVSVRLLGLPLDALLNPLKHLKLMESSTTELSFTHEEVAAQTVKQIRADSYQVDIRNPERITGAIADLTGQLRADVEDRRDGQSCRFLLGCLIRATTGPLFDLLDEVASALAVSENNIEDPATPEGGLLQTLLEDVLGFAFVESDLEVLEVSCGYRLAL